jgi:hypothetical protein
MGSSQEFGLEYSSNIIEADNNMQGAMLDERNESESRPMLLPQ